jgi:subtilisin family serine protease
MMPRFSRSFAIVLLALLWPVAAIGGPAVHVPDELLVRFRAGTAPAHGAALHAAAGAVPLRSFTTVRDLHLVKLPRGLSTAQAIARYRRLPEVLYVEPNHVVTLQKTPNDPHFLAGDLWGLDAAVLTQDIDIDAPEAWEFATGSANVVVAVIDSGIDYTHEDLAANMFRNDPDCNANGVDNDGNGFVDDCFGIAPINGNSDPIDDNDHGSHVAGTIGAVGNNGVGVAGVNWNVRLLPCKMFNADGFGTIAAAIACLDYVALMKDRGVDIVATNNSWSLQEFSQSLLDAIDAHRQRGILFVAAAGNYAYCPSCRMDPDNDRKPTWPANYYLPNVIAVANSNSAGYLNVTSGYGRRTMHIAAPGTNILSTIVGNAYEVFTGTSMAAPHVTGVAALLKAQPPARDWKAIKNLILAGAEGDLYPDNDKLITNKRLNARGSLACANSTVLSRLRPIRDTLYTVAGRPMDLAALHIRCAAPNGNITVTVAPGGQAVTLRDDGAGPDQEAGDGIYSGQWTPAAPGDYTLTFPGADVVTVRVLTGPYTATPVPFADRAITGTSITILPSEPGEITSPFPIRFGGGSFTTLFVDRRGALQFDGGGWGADLPAFNEPLPSPFRSTLIAPFWDDIGAYYNPYGGVFWEVIGTAPNRELVVEWRGLERLDRYCAFFEGYLSFQVVFFESSSDILFNYRDTTFGGECSDADGGAQATVGIQMGPQVATQWSFNTASLADGTSLLWTLGQDPQPAIGVTPTTRDFGNVSVGGSADAPFVVENTGTGTLTGQAHDRRAVQHRRRRRVQPDRRTDPDGDRALQPDGGAAVPGDGQLHGRRRGVEDGHGSRRGDGTVDHELQPCRRGSGDQRGHPGRQTAGCHGGQAQRHRGRIHRQQRHADHLHGTGERHERRDQRDDPRGHRDQHDQLHGDAADHGLHAGERGGRRQRRHQWGELHGGDGRRLQRHRGRVHGEFGHQDHGHGARGRHHRQDRRDDARRQRDQLGEFRGRGHDHVLLPHQRGAGHARHDHRLGIHRGHRGEGSTASRPRSRSTAARRSPRRCRRPPPRARSASPPLAARPPAPRPSRWRHGSPGSRRPAARSAPASSSTGRTSRGGPRSPSTAQPPCSR